MQTQPLTHQPYGITPSTALHMVTQAASPCGRAVFTMPIEAAHILSGTVSLDGRKVLNGPYELSWADKYLGLSRWEQLSTDDAAIVNQLLDDVGNANIASKIAWQESLTREQAETVRIAKARHAKIVNEVINEGGEGYGSPVAPHNDNTPEMKGDDQPE